MLEKTGEDVQAKAFQVKVHIFNTGDPALTHESLNGGLHGKVTLEQRPGSSGGSEEGDASLVEKESKREAGSVNHARVKSEFAQLNNQSAVRHRGQFCHFHPHLTEKG